MASNRSGLLLWLLSMVAMDFVGHSEGATLEDQLVTVNLTNKNLRSIPTTNYGQNVTRMVLKDNSIELSAADYSALANYSSLVELDLENNLIRAVPGKLFSVLPKLKVLNLSSNNISRVAPDAFSGLDNLTELDLSHNLIMSLPTEVFRGLVNLQVLSLRANSLQVLDNRTFADVKRLRSVDLQDNTWNCSCQPLQLLNTLITLQVNIAGALCASPKDRVNHTILETSADCNPEPVPLVPLQASTLTPTLPSTTTATPLPVPSTPATSTAQPTSPNQPTTPSATVVMMTHSTSTSGSNKAPVGGSDDNSGGGGGVPVLGNTWKLLVGVLAIAFCISTVIVCAVKSPSWYKLLFNYRHQRLREDDEPPHIFTTAGGRYSNYSLDTQQTEASAYELEVSSQHGDDQEDEDGYIEDRYIDTANYRAGGGNGKYSSTATAEEDIP